MSRRAKLEQQLADVQQQLAKAVEAAAADRAALQATMAGDMAAAQEAYERQKAEALEAEKEKRKLTRSDSSSLVV